MILLFWNNKSRFSWINAITGKIKIIHCSKFLTVYINFPHSISSLCFILKYPFHYEYITYNLRLFQFCWDFSWYTATSSNPNQGLNICESCSYKKYMIRIKYGESLSLFSLRWLFKKCSMQYFVILWSCLWKGQKSFTLSRT